MNAAKKMCSASSVFRAFMGKIVKAIPDPDTAQVTMELYAEGVISENTRDKVLLPNQTKTEKNTVLMRAVEDAISTQALDTLLSTLDEVEPIVVKEIRAQLNHSVLLEMYCETCDQLFCQYCSITDHEAHKYGLVADVFPKHKKELERELTEVKQQLSILATAQQVMKDRIDQISVQRKEVEQQIRTATQQAIERLKESEKNTIEILKKELQRKSHVVSGQLEELTTKRKELEEFQKFMEKKLSPQQVLKVERKKVEHIRSVKLKVISINLQPEEEADIKFTVNCCKVGEVHNFDVATKVRAIGLGKEVALANETTTFELTTSSSLPLSMDSLSCQLTAPGSSEPVECTITPTQSGGYSISYTPAVRGPHQMRITINGTDISNSPFTIHVYPTPEMRGKQIDTIAGVVNPQGLAVSKSREVMVCDGSFRILVLNKEGNKTRSFGSPGSGTGQFRAPSGIALTHDNNLLVTDSGNHKVQMFTLEGEFVKLVGSAGKKGNGRLQFYHPQGIMVHPSSGKVFIADTCNHRIQVLNSDLTYSHEFGSRGDNDGQFNQPYGIACGTNGDVYVTDHFNHRVQVFTTCGQFICSLVKPESVWYPSGIAIDLLGTVYVSDNKNLSVFDSKGQFIKRIGTRQGVMSTLITNQRSLVGVAVGNTGNILLSCHLTIAVLC